MTVYPWGAISEPFSSLSHFIGALICIPCSIRLLREAGRSRGQRAAISVFCLGCIFLLTLSGVYHLLPLQGTARSTLQRLDHAAIFIFIAGTFTPIHVILFEGFWRWAPLVLIWLVAVAGVTLKTIFFTRIPEAAGISIYLGMGWLGAGTGGLAWAQRGFPFIIPLLGGSLFYSVGTIFEFLHSPVLIPGFIGPHEIFHLMVLAGMAYHWKFIASIFSPARTSAPAPGIGEEAAAGAIL